MPVPAFETLRIIVDADDPIATLELHRPDKLNALSRVLLVELVDACEWLDRRRDLKVVVVRGAGTSFSGGFDLGDFADPDPDLSPRDAADLGRLATESLTDVGQLTVAAVQGHCVGGGVVLAAACDLRLATDDTRFSIPEVDLGIPLAWGGIPRLVREIGPALTKELVLTCRPFDAAEARSIGFVNRVVPAGADSPTAVHDAADALARELAGKAAYSLRTTKQQVNAATEEMIGTRRNAADADALVVAMGDPESREVSRRYLEQRSGQPTSVDSRSS